MLPSTAGCGRSRSDLEFNVATTTLQSFSAHSSEQGLVSSWQMMMTR